MFPTEFEIQMHQKEMRRAAENHHLVQSLRKEDAEPTLWQRLRTHLSVSQPNVEAIQSRGSVKQPKQTKAIA